MGNKIVDVYYGSELYTAGLTEDGREYHAEMYLVLVEYEDGTRLAHNTTFLGCKVDKWVDDETGDYGIHFIDIREEARVAAQRLADRVRKAIFEDGLTINQVHWNGHYPVYGSPAYEEEVMEMTDEERAA